LEVTYNLGVTPVKAKLTFPGEGILRYEIVDWNNVVAQETAVTAISDVAERFFGFGEKFDDLDQSGKLVRTMTFDDPGVKGDHSYKVAPWFVSTRG
jgi:hypothetical protein